MGFGVAAVMEPPLPESREPSCWRVVFVVFSGLVAAVVVNVAVMMLALVIVVAVDAFLSLSCFPPRLLAKVEPMHQWLYDPLVYIPNNVE
jgi:hypothetical protein